MRSYLQSSATSIIDQKTGELLGRLVDIVVDPEKGVVKGVLTHNGKFLSFSDILKWGKHIYIQSDIFLREIEDVPNIQKIFDSEISLIGTRVEDEAAQYLGYSEDFIFDEKTGVLLFIISKKSFLEIFNVKRFQIAANEIVEIAKDRILVKSTTIKDAVPDS